MNSKETVNNDLIVATYVSSYLKKIKNDIKCPKTLKLEKKIQINISKQFVNSLLKRNKFPVYKLNIIRRQQKNK